MANFMLAHLNGGCSGEVCILQEATARRMQETFFTHDSRVNGIAHGFIEYSRNGERIIGHAGNSFAFHSLLLLLPEHNSGIFVAYNSAGGYELVTGILQNALANHYFPVTYENEQPLAGFSERAARYTGIYRPVLKSYSTSEKLISLFDIVRVRVDGGALLVDTRVGPQRFFEFEPGFLRTLDGNDAMYIGDDGQADRGYVFVNSALVYALEKVLWYDSPIFNRVLLIVVLLLCLSTLIAEPVRMVRARRQDQTRTAQPRLAVIARWIGLIGAALSVMTMVCLYFFINDGLSIVLGTVPLRYPLTFLPLSIAVMTAGAIVFTGLAWVEDYWSIGERGHYTLLTIALVGFVWFLYFWNVLVFRL